VTVHAAVAATSLVGRATRRIDRLADWQFALLSFAPGGLLVLLIVVPPILAVFGMSLFRIELTRDLNMPFVGLRNFQRLAADQDFLATVPRTVVFSTGVLILTLPLALATALLLNRRFRGATLLGVAVLLPWAVAPIVTGLYWSFIFNGNFGLATGVLMALGLTTHPIAWLQDTRTAVVIAMVAMAWRSVPLDAILLLAALKTIPQGLYRAARMDGAGAWQSFRFVTLPGIRNMLLLVGILELIRSLQVFDVLYLLTGGGPGQETTVINYFIYQRTVLDLSFGYAAALALFLVAIIVGLSVFLLYFRVRRGTASEPMERVGELTPERPWRAKALPPIVARIAPDSANTHVTGPTSPPRGGLQLALPRWVGTLGVGAASTVLLLWLLGPIVWIVIVSLQPEEAVTTAPPRLTANLRIDRYISLLTDPNWIKSFGVSLEVALLTTGLVLVIGSLAAYPLARLDLPGKRLLLGVLIFTQMIPAIVLAIPVLLLFQRLGLKDTVPALVLVDVAFWLPLIIWLLRNLLEDVPRALESAARMDGCSRLGTLFRVTVPAAGPGIAATAILLIIGTWNEFLFAVVLGDRNAVTMTRRISQIQVIGTAAGVPPFTLVAAAGVLVALPCVLLALVFHRRVVAGLTEGFVKG
jgi:multiple sugar transport system permease protein